MSALRAVTRFKEAIMLRFRLHLLMLVSLLSLTACSGSAPATDTTAADASSIRDMVEEWLGYWNTSDGQGLSTLYLSDAVAMHPGGPSAAGRDAIRRDFEGGFEQFDGTQSATVDEVHVQGNLAYARGEWMVTGGAAPDVDGDWMWVLNRQPDGEWRIARHISNQSIAAP